MVGSAGECLLAVESVQTHRMQQPSIAIYLFSYWLEANKSAHVTYVRFVVDCEAEDVVVVVVCVRVCGGSGD